MSGLNIDKEKLDNITINLNTENDVTASNDPLDLEITRLLAEQVEEPSVSPEFVDRWTARAAAIIDGQNAEKKLEDANTTLNREETVDLTAKSVVGRLMLGQMPPKGVTGEQMVSQLKSLPAFRMQADKPRSRLMYDIRTGELVRSIVKNTPHARTAAAEKAGPEAVNAKKAPEPPHIAAPQKGM